MPNDNPDLSPDSLIEKPVLTFPEDVSKWVKSHYKKASVILEYGSGGSTVLASEMPGKTVFSVESDASWLENLQQYLDTAGVKSPILLHHADIGPTGKWGRPKDNSGWENYHKYPLSVWDRPDFVAPDLVLIDGRFRAACFLTTMLRTEKPITVLFDDYKERQKYHVVEEFSKPVEFVDRMAKFQIEPFTMPRDAITKIIGLFAKTF